MQQNPSLWLLRSMLGCAALLAVSAQASADANRANGVWATSSAVGSLQLVSASASGAAANGSSTTCAVSADGTLVLFSSSATNLVTGDTNRVNDLFLKDLNTGSVLRVTAQSNGAPIATGGDCLGTTMTHYGRLVAFNASNREAVFVKDTETGLLIQATPPVGTLPQVRGFFGGVLSDDGSKLVFLTQPETRPTPGFGTENLIPRRLMLRDLSTGALRLVLSRADIGADAVLSGDARQVAFTRLYSGWDARVFVRDLATGEETLASSSSNGVPSNGNSNGRFLSRDGTRVVFGSSARNLVSPRPPANTFQVYAKVIAAPTTSQR